MTSFLCASFFLVLGGRTVSAAEAGPDGRKSTLSLHPIGTLALNLAPGYNFFQFTYEYHPGPGRLSWAWDPVLILNDESEADNPHHFSLWILPIVTPRWYFRQTGEGWFAGLKLGYIHISFVNDSESPTYTPERDHHHTEMGYGTGEIGFKHDWSALSFYVSGQLGLTMGAEFQEYSRMGQAPRHSTGGIATPFGQIDCGLGYRF